MRKKLSLSIVILLIVSSLAYFGTSCNTPATATPTGTANAYLDAIAAQDAQAIVSYEAEGTGDMTSAQLETQFEGIKSFSITNRNLVVDSETATTATVSANYDGSMTLANDSTIDQAVDVIFTLTKVDGKWLISDMANASGGGSGSGDEAQRKSEKTNVALAVGMMMLESGIGTIRNPITVPTNDMSAFPDATSVAGSADKLLDADDDAYTANDKDGYVLYQHDKTADGSSSTGLVNYLPSATNTYYYTIDADTTLHQWDAPGGTEYTD